MTSWRTKRPVGGRVSRNCDSESFSLLRLIGPLPQLPRNFVKGSFIRTLGVVTEVWDVTPLGQSLLVVRQ